MTSAFAGHCGRPPALHRLLVHLPRSARKKGMPVTIMMMHSGSRKKAWPTTSIQLRTRLRHHVVHDVDADVFVVLAASTASTEKDDAEQHPLQLEPGVRGGVEHLAHGGVDGRHQPRRARISQDKALADPRIGGVDHPRYRQQRLKHCVEGAHRHLHSVWPAGRHPPPILFLRYAPSAWPAGHAPQP